MVAIGSIGLIRWQRPVVRISLATANGVKRSRTLIICSGPLSWARFGGHLLVRERPAWTRPMVTSWQFPNYQSQRRALLPIPNRRSPPRRPVCRQRWINVGGSEHPTQLPLVTSAWGTGRLPPVQKTPLARHSSSEVAAPVGGLQFPPVYAFVKAFRPPARRCFRVAAA